MSLPEDDMTWIRDQMPWIEKYRPQTTNEIVLDDETKKHIKVFMLNQRDVHLIITGVPGIGKTSTVRCIAKEILGQYYQEGFLALNAADERGTRIISTTIPPFCKRASSSPHSKIILLDEADNMTGKCQSDINNMIKLYGKNTKFIFTCNDSTKIIEDIQSICRIVRYKPLSADQIMSYMEKIAIQEGIQTTKSGLITICNASRGDMRCAINNLQLVSTCRDIVNEKAVLEACNIPNPGDIQSVIDLCMEGKLNDAVKVVNNIIDEGYYLPNIISSFSDSVEMGEMEHLTKLKILDIINEVKINISYGVKSKLQIIALVARLCEIK
jgi:replication factor C subunit 2/4